VYLSVGSANWNRRSMTSDSEIAATLIDREHLDDDRDGVRVGVLAREFRLQKFREFTGLEYDELARMSLMEAVQAMDDAASDSAGIIKPADVRRRTYFDVIPDELIDFADPFDQCE
jgi:phospholipase D1/2